MVNKWYLLLVLSSKITRNYKAAYGQIHWWLKHRWAQLAVIMAIETRHAGLEYAGGSAQQQAAAFHAQAQAQDDWLEDGAYR
jgi:hypothetical protein